MGAGTQRAQGQREIVSSDRLCLATIFSLIPAHALLIDRVAPTDRFCAFGFIASLTVVAPPVLPCVCACISHISVL